MKTTEHLRLEQYNAARGERTKLVGPAGVARRIAVSTVHRHP
jgi:hypothetical protein